MAIKKIPVGELQAGMILAQPINDQNGRTIMPEGARLTPMHLKRLEKWGVDAVAIHADESTGQPESEEKIAARESIQQASAEDKEFMRKVAVEVMERFQNVGENPVMAELKRLAVRHLVTRGRGAIPGR